MIFRYSLFECTVLNNFTSRRLHKSGKRQWRAIIYTSLKASKQREDNLLLLSNPSLFREVKIKFDTAPWQLFLRRKGPGKTRVLGDVSLTFSVINFHLYPSLEYWNRFTSIWIWLRKFYAVVGDLIIGAPSDQCLSLAVHIYQKIYLTPDRSIDRSADLFVYQRLSSSIYQPRSALINRSSYLSQPVRNYLAGFVQLWNVGDFLFLSRKRSRCSSFVKAWILIVTQSAHHPLPYQYVFMAVDSAIPTVGVGESEYEPKSARSIRYRFVDLRSFRLQPRGNCVTQNGRKATERKKN